MINRVLTNNKIEGAQSICTPPFF